jgi:hypothetical protein
MKRISFSVYTLLACIWVISGTNAWGQANPLTWSSFVAGNVYYDSSQPGTSDVVSRFTPGKAITVTRIEVQAAQGSQRFSFSPTFEVIACTNPVAFKVTDGSKSFALPLPSAATLVTGGNNPSSADSGPLNLKFSAGADVVMAVVQGDLPDPNDTGCFANYSNITVQYKIKTSDE